MPATPVVVQDPVVHLTKDGEDKTSAFVDVSCDFTSLDLAPDMPVTTIQRFCGSVQVPGPVTESAVADLVINDDTLTRWAPLVGEKVHVEVWDTPTDAKPLTFDSFIAANPGLYGSRTPGEAVAITGWNLPVMVKVAEGTGAVPAAPSA